MYDDKKVNAPLIRHSQELTLCRGTVPTSGTSKPRRLLEARIGRAVSSFRYRQPGFWILIARYVLDFVIAMLRAWASSDKPNEDHNLEPGLRRWIATNEHVCEYRSDP